MASARPLTWVGSGALLAHLGAWVLPPGLGQRAPAPISSPSRVSSELCGERGRSLPGGGCRCAPPGGRAWLSPPGYSQPGSPSPGALFCWVGARLASLPRPRLCAVLRGAMGWSWDVMELGSSEIKMTGPHGNSTAFYPTETPPKPGLGRRWETPLRCSG